MPSQARSDFDHNYADIERLIEIHEELAGTGPGYKHGVEVLNKSAVVLTSAVWEAYCEDLASEAVDHLIAKLSDPTKLPKELRKRIARELEDNPNDPGRLGSCERRLEESSQEPGAVDRRRAGSGAGTRAKTKQIAPELFEDAVGLTKVTSAWTWQGMNAKGPAQSSTSWSLFAAT